MLSTAEISNIDRIQSSLRIISKATFDISNYSLHSDLKIPQVFEIAETDFKRFISRLIHHKNPLISESSFFIIPENPNKRLKKLVGGVGACWPN